MKIKNLVLVVLLISMTYVVYGATYYAVASGSWSSASTWASTSGGTGGAGIPTSSDVVYIGEGSGTYTVTVPAGNHGAQTIRIGNPAGNAAGGTLTFAGNTSLLTVSGSLTIYRSTASSTRAVNVGPGTLTVNSNIILSSPAGTDLGSVSQILLGSGTITTNNLNFLADPSAPLQAQVVVSGSGTINVRGNIALLYGGGTLVPGTGTVALNGSLTQTINGGPDILFYNLNPNNPSGIVLTGLVVVEGTWTQGVGTVTGTLPNVDGYTSIAYDMIAINADDNMMIGFWIDMTTPALFPAYVDRQWELGGSYTGIKTVTFYWYDADDHNFDWTGRTVAAWHDGDYYLGEYDTEFNPNYIEITVNPIAASGIYNIGLFPEATLPVELSSFTAVVTAQNLVQLNWVSQSESNLAGYYVYRSMENSLVQAQMVSPIIPATNTSSAASYYFIDAEIDPGMYYYWVQSMEMNGSFNYHGSISVILNALEDNTPPVIPGFTGIEKIYPNPFNPSTRISYFIEKAVDVNLAIVNLKGQLVRTLVSSHKDPGAYYTAWDGKDENGSNMASGVYFVRMIAGKKMSSRKIVMLK